METRPENWPQAVDELLPHTLFRLAAQYPDLTYSEYPRSNDAADGYNTFTFKEVANADHAVAWWIDHNVGKPEKDDGSETLVYMGPSDLRYGLLVLGSVMAGYKMLFPTPRYGAEAITELISRANGSVMLTPSVPFPVASEILAKRPMQTFDLPSVEHFLTANTAPYLFTKSFEAHKQEPLVCLHTSGTTGFPKPVIWTHDWYNSVVAGHCLPAPNGYDIVHDLWLGPQKRIMAVFPHFHASGVMLALFFPLLLGTTVVYPPSAPGPKEAINAVADVLDELDEARKVDVLALPPLHVEFLGANAAVLDRIAKRVNTLSWGGGDVSHAAGSAIAVKIQLLNIMASTELGLWSQIHKSGSGDEDRVDDEWHYLAFHPSLGIRFDAVSEGGEGTLYEAIMVKNKGEGAWVQPIFKLFPGVAEVTLGDVFTRHPSNSGKWKHAGRADDLMNFLTGETFHPGSAERRIAAHTGVAEVLLVGTRRPKASLLVRLNQDADLDSVWNVVDEVNQISPLYARVERHMIFVVTVPFLRTAKGTVQRRAVLDLYEGELDALYAKDGSYIPVR